MPITTISGNVGGIRFPADSALCMPTIFAFLFTGRPPGHYWTTLYFVLAALVTPVTLWAQPTSSIDLSKASRLMPLNDPTYRAAVSEQAAAQAELAKGRAGLLPVIQFSYSYNRVSGSRWQPDFRGLRAESDLSYNSKNSYIQLRQPLLDFSRYATYQRGQALASRGSANFVVQQQRAGLRMAETYFNLLLAHNQHALNEALAASLTSIVATLQAKLRESEATIIEVQETEARLSLARADVIASQDQLAVSARELQAIIGLPPLRIALIRNDFPLPTLSPTNIDEWLERGRLNNPETRAAQEAVRVADAEVDQAGSQYLPTLNLMAAYGKTQSDSLSSLDQRSNTFTVGLQLEIPIFTGGYTTANVARTRADRARLQYELGATIERTQTAITRAYTDTQRGAERIRALQSAVESGLKALESVKKGFDAGLQSNLDVLNTQDKLFQARFDLVKAQVDYLRARVTLSAAVGELDTQVFDEISTTYLTP